MYKDGAKLQSSVSWCTAFLEALNTQYWDPKFYAVSPIHAFGLLKKLV